MAHYLRQLRASCLPLDWMTIALGFNGIEATWQNASLTRDEVHEYALDQLADAADMPDEEPTFMLADADLTNWNAFPGPLAVLSARSGVSRETALRKWRYSATLNFVEKFQTLPEPGEPELEAYQDWCDFRNNWHGVVPDYPWVDDSLAGWGWASDEITAFLDGCRDWLENERVQLVTK